MTLSGLAIALMTIGAIVLIALLIGAFFPKGNGSYTKLDSNL